MKIVFNNAIYYKDLYKYLMIEISRLCLHKFTVTVQILMEKKKIYVASKKKY